uniref:Uncharacterized protein n=1 Tax=Chromera velia CCMP2878 TaxID=1169474 RepID=A0A0G4HFJ6_9ALVE|eukprot:Cvel_6650.t1-p1 / transcript=Cvel_6650.t1 / gene=Cvel_6650 / organism=Chromera_velia_CCMP2878 / gene_product=hypothetical protein / transcript_product=hypothetical protein / location=Cvel_scaffold330:22082-23038(+) / protein_length=160 / sequence_SO=supercontig / SO=protein_coding / is_pseudo=false
MGESLISMSTMYLNLSGNHPPSENFEILDEVPVEGREEDGESGGTREGENEREGLGAPEDSQEAEGKGMGEVKDSMGETEEENEGNGIIGAPEERKKGGKNKAVAGGVGDPKTFGGPRNVKAPPCSPFVAPLSSRPSKDRFLELLNSEAARLRVPRMTVD